MSDTCTAIVTLFIYISVMKSLKSPFQGGWLLPGHSLHRGSAADDDARGGSLLRAGDDDGGRQVPDAGDLQAEHDRARPLRAPAGQPHGGPAARPAPALPVPGRASNEG